MTDVTVTMTVGTTIHYMFIPQAAEATMGLTVAPIVYGWSDAQVDGSPTTVSIDLDSDYVYDVRVEARNAPPIVFRAFTPASGDLLTLLTAQGWVPL